MNELAPPQPLPPQNESRKDSWVDFVRFAALAAAIVIPVRLFIAQPFVVSGASMVPSFESGHYLIIDELSYRFENPKRGDVVVFRFPSEPSTFLIKRVAGLPGETIEIRGSDVRIANETNPKGFLWQQGDISAHRTMGQQKIMLAEGEYFVLGDNRDESADSRLWGPLKRELIVGRPLIRLFPLDEVEVFPGEWQTIETE